MGRFDVISRRLVAAIIIFSTAIYALAFWLLDPAMKPATGALVTFPVTVAAWFLGLRKGIIAALLAVPLSTLLYNVIGVHGWFVSFQGGGVAGWVVLLLVAVIVGWLSDVRWQMRREREVLRQEVYERTKVELALRESEAEWRSLVDTAPCIIMRLDNDGRILFINHGPPGITAEEVIGHTVYDLVIEEHRDVMRRTVGHVFRTGEIASYEVALNLPDGSIQWRAGRIGPIVRNGEIVEATLVSTDSTERRRAEETARRLAAIVHSSADAITAVSSDGITTEWNEAATRVYGYTAEEMIGQPISIMHAPNWVEEGAQLAARVQAGERIEGYETVRLKKDGTQIDVSVTIFPLRDFSGNVVGRSAITRDVTERKRAEEALRYAKDELEHRVEERTEELVNANERLNTELREHQIADKALVESNQRLKETLADLQQTQQQVVQQERLRALGQMAGGVAHDLNNALVSVVGFSELLLIRPEVRKDSAKLTHYIKTIHTASEDAANIVGRLREFFRHRERDEVRAPFRINDVVRQAIPLTQPRWKDQAMARGITIEIRPT